MPLCHLCYVREIWRLLQEGGVIRRVEVKSSPLSLRAGGRSVLRRVIATGGDSVVPRDGAELLTVVPYGFVWLECDNCTDTSQHCDSNYEGPLPIALINGTVAIVLPDARAPPRLPCDRVYPRYYA
eukprot:IDg15703t1